MNEYEYTDFLIKKSVQPHSLRNLHGAINQNQNLTLFLNKKAAQIRQEGSNQAMNTMEIIESKKLQVQSLPDADRYIKQITHPKEMNWRELLKDSDHIKIMQLMSRDQYVDDVIVVSEGSKLGSNSHTAQQRQLEKLKSEKSIWTIENKLKFVMGDKLKFEDIKKLHQQYITEKVKRNFWEQRFQMEEPSSPLTQDNNIQLDALRENQIIRNTAEHFKQLREKSREASQRQNNPSQQSVTVRKDSQSQEGSPTNNKSSTQNFTFYNIVDLAQKNLKQSKETQKQSQQNDGIIPEVPSNWKQHFIDTTDRINIQSKFQSNITTQPPSQRQLKEINIDKISTDRGRSYQNISFSEISPAKDGNNLKPKVKKSCSIHPHFEVEYNQDNNEGNIQNERVVHSQRKQNRSNSKDSCQTPRSNMTNRIDSKINVGINQQHEGDGGVKSSLSINPFHSEIFISNKELETEKIFKGQNPGEKYEKLREANTQNEKKLIDFISKKNKFQLIDLFPNNVKVKPYRYIKFDEIQLNDFDKEAYYQQKMDQEKVSRKSVDKNNIQNKNPKQESQSQQDKNNKKGQSKTEKSSPVKEKTQPKPQYKKRKSIVDQLVESTVKEQNVVEKKRIVKTKKPKSQCMQRLTKEADQNSLQYLRKYGLEETINLKDDYSKLRLTAATAATGSTRIVRRKYSLDQRDGELSNRSSLQASPKNDPYQLNTGLFKKLTQPPNQLYNLLNSEENKEAVKYKNDINTLQLNDLNSLSATGTTFNQGWLSTRSDNNSHLKSKSSLIKPFQQNINQNKNLTARENNTHMRSDSSFSFLLSPFTKNSQAQITLSTERTPCNNNQQLLTDRSQKDFFKVRGKLFTADSSGQNQRKLPAQIQSKSQQWVQEKQNNIKENFQLKENFINFYDSVITTSKEQAKSSCRLNRQIKNLVKKVDKNLASIQSSEGPKLSTLNHEFRDFKEMKIFKRKLFNYAVNKIHPDDRKSLFELYSMTHRKEVEDIFAQQMKK